jgi:hypothetical protein
MAMHCRQHQHQFNVMRELESCFLKMVQLMFQMIPTNFIIHAPSHSLGLQITMILKHVSMFLLYLACTHLCMYKFHNKYKIPLYIIFSTLVMIEVSMCNTYGM